jgi:hypothetical protein
VGGQGKLPPNSISGGYFLFGQCSLCVTLGSWQYSW